jgi:hypothetical protein
MSGQRGTVVGGIVIVALSLAADQPPAKPGNLKPALAMVRDRDWAPLVGYTGEIIYDNVPAVKSLEAYQQYATAHLAGDAVGVNDFFAKNPGVRIARGTQILIIQVLRPSLPSHRVSSMMSLDGFPIAPKGTYPLEVRILDGELKDQKRFVPEDAVAHMIPAPVVPGRKKVVRSLPSSKPADPVARATTLIRSAQNLEATGKLAGALAIYRQVVQEYPGTPQAVTAAGRIQALGKP